MADNVKRIPIYKYVKSGKITAIAPPSRFDGRTLIDLSPDLTRIEKIRSVKHLNHRAFSPTEFTLEAIEAVQRRENNEYSISYRLLRILTDKDIDEARWTSTNDLAALPVGAHPNISAEERRWAGEREGNFGSGIGLSVLACGSWWWLYSAIRADDSFIIPAVVSLVATYFLAQFKWRPSKNARADRLSELNKHKRMLRENVENQYQHDRTELEQALADYSYWEHLTPEEFERALVVYLQKDGHELHATQYSGDGGVDLQGITQEGNRIIVQAKKYRTNVGVAVVREMIGVRESTPGKPTTMIVALAGFTRGAKKLAEHERIILKSIRQEILNV